MRDFEMTASFCYDCVEDFQPDNINTLAIVHFRPQTSWDGKDYGFDWMRNGDYNFFFPPNKGDDHVYKDLVSDHYKKGTRTLETNGNNYEGDFEKSSVKFGDLERYYKYYLISAKRIPNPETGIEVTARYYCPWMSIYPQTKVTLNLIVDVLEDDCKATFNFEENQYFRFTLNPITGLKKGLNTRTDYVTIECLDTFSEPQAIHILTTNKYGGIYVAGCIMVWPNKGKMKKLNTVYINVKLPKVTNRPRGILENQIPSKLSSVAEEPFIEFTDKSLRQALIECNRATEINLDLTKHIDKATFDSLYLRNKQVVCYYETGYKFEHNDEKNRLDRKYNSAPETYICITDFLYDCLQKELESRGQDKDKFRNHLRLFDVPSEGIRLVYDEFGNLTESAIGGYHDPYTNNIVLLKDLSDMAIAHEIGHALGLNHSFSNKFRDHYTPNALYTYKAGETDNIMDYITKPLYRQKKIFWKWQWKIMNNNVKADNSPKIEHKYER